LRTGAAQKLVGVSPRIGASSALPTSQLLEIPAVENADQTSGMSMHAGCCGGCGGDGGSDGDPGGHGISGGEGGAGGDAGG